MIAGDPPFTVEAADLLEMYERMAVIRRTEKAAHDLFLSGLVRGTTHLASGHEAGIWVLALAGGRELGPGRPWPQGVLEEQVVPPVAKVVAAAKDVVAF